ncbi:MAG: AAA family ATPase [Chloroflexi bacterium]|nr:AAA family ATPase [Chloroflexota bacterium]
MPNAQPDQSLHLPSLVIKNFRGIDELTIPRLGRVTLLAGKNGVGKTTVLDAVRVWAGRGRLQVLEDVLSQRGDTLNTIDRQGEQNTVIDWYALFTDRRSSTEIEVLIGSSSTTDTLRIGWQSGVRLQSDEPVKIEPDDFVKGAKPALVARVGNSTIYPSNTVNGSSPPPAVPFNVLGPDGPSDAMVERFWSEVALTSHEDQALDALNLITDAQVERVAALGTPTGNGITQPRRMTAKVQGKDYQVPLRTLGDGALRTYAVALALAKSTNGFLLIDEAENGIHHTIQPKFWKMVLQTAERNNVQVLATTHSWDCVKGFAQAANELEEVEGLLVRIERVPIGLRAITYDESRLDSIVKYGIEAR